jgi:hypothetical protein
MINYHKKYIKYKNKYSIKKLLVGGCKKIITQAELNLDYFILFNAPIKEFFDFNLLESLNDIYKTIISAIPQKYFETKYFTNYEEFNILIPLLSINNYKLFIGHHFSTPPIGILESFIYKNLGLSKCNYLRLVFYVYQSKIIKIIIFNQNNFKFNIIFDGTKEPPTIDFEDLYKGIIKCFNENINITMTYCIYLLKKEIKSKTLIDEDKKLYRFEQEFNIESRHVVFITIYLLKNEIKIDYFSYIAVDAINLLKNFFNFLFKCYDDDGNKKQVIINDLIPINSLQAKINDLTKEEIKTCLTEPIKNIMEILPYSDVKSDLGHSIDVWDEKLSYSDDIIQIIMDNLHGSCATIVFIYKCFYLINTEIPINERSKIIYKYLDSLDICDIIKLILYYQSFIYEFQNNNKEKLEQINQLLCYENSYSDLYSCSQSIDKILPFLFKI